MGTDSGPVQVNRAAILFTLATSLIAGMLTLVFLTLTEHTYTACLTAPWLYDTTACQNATNAHYALFAATIIACVVAAVAIIALTLDNLSTRSTA